MPRRRSPPFLLSPPVLIILLPTLALLLLFFILYLFLSTTSRILKPNTNSVKKSWDSINIVLVLFAIICGVFARRNDDSNNDRNAESDGGKMNYDSTKMNYYSTPNSQPWFELPERKTYGDPPIRAEASGGGRRLRRNSSSYPDLRQESLWGNGERFSFFDDFELSKYRSPPIADDHVQLRRWRSEIEDKEIPVDTFVVRSSPPPSSTPPPQNPPPTAAEAARHKPRRAYESVGRKERVEKVIEEVKLPPQTPPPPPPPLPRPPPSPQVKLAFRLEQKQGKLEPRKSNATKEIKMVLSSLYNQRKRKRKQKISKSQDQFDNSSHSPPGSSQFDIPATSPPPPPPPPPSIFHNIFKFKSKSKKIHSVPQPPPPPPPPQSAIPPYQRKNHIPPPPESSSRRRIPSSSGKPPFPKKPIPSLDENPNSGSQSPLIQIPSPPPPLPFKMPDLIFAAGGDFIRIQSANSSRCSSPGLDDDGNIPSNPVTAPLVDGGDGDGITNGGSVFCPSPDVNVKADTFIARLRGNWQLEKINSLREKRNVGHGQ